MGDFLYFCLTMESVTAREGGNADVSLAVRWEGYEFTDERGILGLEQRVENRLRLQGT